MLNQMKVTALEEIKVVQEYLDVLPDELLGMPLDRDIKFLMSCYLEHILSLRGHIECP
jgi:hypothetical protein